MKAMMEVSSISRGNLCDDAASDSSIAPEGFYLARPRRTFRKEITRHQLGSKIILIYICVYLKENDDIILLMGNAFFATPVAGLSRARIAINGKIFSRKSLLNNDFLEALVRYVYSRGSFSMGNYDTMQMSARAPRGESARSRLSSKLYFFVRASRRVNTELDPRHGIA